MEYTYRFSDGPVEIKKLIEEYHNFDRTRKFCYQCPNYEKNWSCPDYNFDEKEWLNNYNYAYLIGKEYHIPREDRQKTIGVAKVGDYAVNAMKVLKVSAFKDLLALEQKVPGSVALMPGNCVICELSDGLTCTKETGEGACRHPEILRYSLESLGLDVDSIMKFEIGMFLQWPKEGHLPDKLCGVMALLTKEPLDMAIIKEHFPDTKKDWRAAVNADKPQIKRNESWLENLENKNRDKAESEISRQTESQWIGFKSELLNSDDTPWKRQLEEAAECPSEPEDHVENTEPDGTENYEDASSDIKEQPEEKTSEEIEISEGEKHEQHQSTPEEEILQPDEEADDSEEETKYKWLGFKREVAEEEDIQSKWK